MIKGKPTDEVVAALANIEMHRQKMKTETGPAAAGNEALRKLHELLERERQALQLHGEGAGHTANIEALTAEIEKMKEISGARTQSTGPRHARNQVKKRMVQSSRPHNPPRNKGRRTMGRRGDR